MESYCWEICRQCKKYSFISIPHFDRFSEFPFLGLPLGSIYQDIYLMQVSKTSVMAMKSYTYRAELLLRDYLLADPYVLYTSVLCGIVMCKMVCFFCLPLFWSFPALNCVNHLIRRICNDCGGKQRKLHIIWWQTFMYSLLADPYAISSFSRL